MIDILKNYKLVPSPYVNDYKSVKRTWKERLFTFPWKPFLKEKTEYEPKGFLFMGEAIVSYQTYEKLKKELDNESGTC